MCRTVRAEANEVLAQQLRDTRKHKRSPTEDRAEKDLKPAVAANIIESTPNGRAFGLAGFDCGRQTGQAMHNHLWYAGSARCEKNPFGRGAIESDLYPRPDL